MNPSNESSSRIFESDSNSILMLISNCQIETSDTEIAQDLR